MFKSCTQRYTDMSDEKQFRFDFFCDICGEVFSAAPMERISSDPPSDTPEGKRLRKMLWRREHTEAFKRANYEASNHFFYCPCCGLYVCDACTFYKKDREGDMTPVCCVSCKRRMRSAKRKVYQAAELKYVYGPHPPAQQAKKPPAPQEKKGN